MSFPALGRGAKPYEIENAINRILRWLNPGLDSGAADKVLTSTGDDLQWQDLPVQNLLQMVSFETGAVATGTTQIPGDDTIPQSNEGDQYMSLSITPKSATSKLVIDVVWHGASSYSSVAAMAVPLFRDSGTDALAVGWTNTPAAGYPLQVKYSHVADSGSTDAATFKVRAGIGAAGTTTFNGAGGSRLFGGVTASSIIIREYSA